ncbi:DUF2750 domain-containing protein [Thalassotalea profundi]|uniref:DUF2750 domain-containing protein n=1 Tax=Thalassotalea profundi TaxID=2036687 RepID=A0ABQ3IV55_9GAMM|nr:DUF2750 domain-containing protein [Thalassotalea profundi]GHE92039.1 hypothetical protein GCM10011501_21950 [Thalassotalea profundi]
MSQTNTTLSAFLAECQTSQTLWALQDKASEDWVVLDSINFEDSEVMPLWSSKSLAQAHCIDEWANYIPCEISLADWFEFWVEDLNEDNVIVGVDWQNDDEFLEMELADFTQALAEIESFK